MNVMSLPTSRRVVPGRGDPLEDTREPSFGALLRNLRFEAGLTQEALAERAELGAVTVGALERGFRSVPRPATVAKLTEALNLAADARVRLESAATRPVRPRRRRAVHTPTAAETNCADAAAPSFALQVVSIIVCGSTTEALTELSRLKRCVLLIGPRP